MFSITRRRRGLMAISVIGGSCLEDEVATSSILKTRRRPHHHPFTSRRSSPALPCAPRPPATAGSINDPKLPLCEATLRPGPPGGVLLSGSSPSTDHNHQPGLWSG